jgi:hypothetical protein
MNRIPLKSGRRSKKAVELLDVPAMEGCGLTDGRE